MKKFNVYTVGSGAPGISKERKSPATLVQLGKSNFLVDAGSGASASLFAGDINPADVKNMFFTHLHADHSLDYGYFLIIGWHDGRRELNLAGPRGTKKMHDMITEVYNGDIMYRANLGVSLKGIKEDVNFIETNGGDTFEIDGVKISTLHVPHTAYAVSYKFEAQGQTVVVSGDLMYSEKFTEFSKDADLIVFDANQADSKFMQDRGPSFVANLEKSHATIPQIAEMAKKSNAKKIILTHLTEGVFEDKLLETVSSIYKGEIVIASDMKKIEV